MLNGEVCFVVGKSWVWSQCFQKVHIFFVTLNSLQSYHSVSEKLAVQVQITWTWELVAWAVDLILWDIRLKMIFFVQVNNNWPMVNLSG